MKNKFFDFGLLILRVGIGVSFIVNHGYAKISGGPAKWEATGSSMETFGITFLPVFWGFMAAFTEFFGAMLLAIGFLTRGAAALLSFMMFVAFYHHIAGGDGFAVASHPFELMLVCIFILITGAGKYSLDNNIKFIKWLQ